MRIAVVNQHPSVALGGSETQCDLIAAELVRRGHEVRYVAPGGATGATSYEVVGVADRARLVVGAVLAHGPDVVYWRFGTRHLAPAVRRLHRADVAVVFAASHENDLRRWSTPPSARPRGPARAAEVLRDRLRSAVGHEGLLRTDGVVVNNADLLDLVGVEPRVHIPNGIDPAQEPFEWPRPYIAWVANLKPAKRPEACIPLARAVADLGVDVVMAGRPQVAEYAAFGRRADLPDNLHVLGPLEPRSAAGLLASAAVHVHTCEPEGFPNVFLQAWRHSVPSVSLGFDPGGVIGREGLGAVVGDDPGRFHMEVRRLLTDTAARRAAGARAAAYATRTGDVATNVARLEEFLREVLDRRARSADGA